VITLPLYSVEGSSQIRSSFVPAAVKRRRNQRYCSNHRFFPTTCPPKCAMRGRSGSGPAKGAPPHLPASEDERHPHVASIPQQQSATFLNQQGASLLRYSDGSREGSMPSSGTMPRHSCGRLSAERPRRKEK